MNRISVIQNWQPWSWMILFQTFWVQSKNSIYISRLYEFETWRRNQFSISVSSRQTSHDCAGKCYVFLKRRRGFHRVFNSISCSLTFFTCVANIWRIKNAIASLLRENMYGYLSLDIICSSKLTVSASWNRKFEKMTADKYLHLFWRQIGEIVYIALYGDLKFSRVKHSAI